MTWSVSRSFLQRMTVCHVFVSLGYFLIFATWAPIVGLLAEEKIVEVPQTVIQTVDRHVPKIEIQEIATWTYYHYSLVLLWIDCLLVLWWIVFIQLLHGKLPLVFWVHPTTVPRVELQCGPRVFSTYVRLSSVFFKLLTVFSSGVSKSPKSYQGGREILNPQTNHGGSRAFKIIQSQVCPSYLA